MINVSNQIIIREVNGRECKEKNPTLICLSSHKMIGLVVLKFPDSPNTYTVSKRDLTLALENALNANHCE